jgi:ribosomal protein S12 methylthiotransferase accessory factor
VQTASAIQKRPLGCTQSQAECLLDLLDGQHKWNDITNKSLIDSSLLHETISWFSSLGLLDDDATPLPHNDIRPRHFEQLSRASPSSSQTFDILVVGLGELGLSVLRALLAFSNVRLRILDPVPVQLSDVGTFYRHWELGQAKADIVRHYLGTDEQLHIQTITNEDRGEGWELQPHVSQADLVICCVDQPSFLIEKVFRVCDLLKVRFVPAEITDSGGCVGPVFVPENRSDRAACSICAALFRNRGEFSNLLLPYLKKRFPLPARWRYPHASSLAPVLATYVTLAMIDVLENHHGPHLNDSRVVSLNINTADAEVRPTPKHYGCERCFPSAEQTREQILNETTENWQTFFSGEVREPVPLKELWQRLKVLVGEESSIFHSLDVCSGAERQSVYRFFSHRGADPRASLIPTVHQAVAKRELFDGNKMHQVSTSGLDFYDVVAAKTLAVVEGLERLFTLNYYDPHRVIQRAYSGISKCALDPRTFPLFDESQYRDSEFGLCPFSPDETIPWICGARVSDGKSVFVPLDLVYRNTSSRAIWSPSSNGAACHSSFHRAVLNGMYETIERDALMLVWLNQMSLPIVDFSEGDLDPFGVRKDFRKLSFELKHVDITTDLNIPVLLGVLRDTRNPDVFLTTMAASLRMNRLLEKVYRELIQFSYSYLSCQVHHKNAISDCMDPNSVMTFADHLSFYQHRSKAHLVSFLTSSHTRKPISCCQHSIGDLSVADELNIVLQRLSGAGYQVIVVDCTPQFLRDLGLHAVKVLIPGLHPLNVSHRHRVLSGRRLFSAARLMGLADADKTMQELNPWPHPFW